MTPRFFRSACRWHSRRVPCAFPVVLRATQLRETVERYVQTRVFPVAIDATSDHSRPPGRLLEPLRHGEISSAPRDRSRRRRLDRRTACPTSPRPAFLRACAREARHRARDRRLCRVRCSTRAVDPGSTPPRSPDRCSTCAAPAAIGSTSSTSRPPRVSSWRPAGWWSSSTATARSPRKAAARMCSRRSACGWICRRTDLRRCVETVGIGFLFAPHYHPAFKAVAPVRRQLAAEGAEHHFQSARPAPEPGCGRHINWSACFPVR